MHSGTNAFSSLASTLLVALLISPLQLGAQEQPLPFEITENRERCDHYDPLKQPFFGELHIHTAYSFDASAIGTRNTPADAYRFARGDAVGLAPFIDSRLVIDQQLSPAEAPLIPAYDYCMPGERCKYMATRTTQLPPGRSLDFVAVTDHSEQLGEANICLFEPVFACDDDSECPTGQSCQNGLCTPVGYNAVACQGIRQAQGNIYGGSTQAIIIPALENTAENPSRPKLCTADLEKGDRCVNQARTVWQQIQLDAEEAYDRTSACQLTSFIAYEYTAMMGTGICEQDGKACWEDIDCDPWADQAQTCLPNTAGSFPGAGGSANLHRNIIFRNAQVPATPISNVEQPVGCGQGENCQRLGSPKPPLASPEQMLFALKEACQGNPDLPNCDVLSIPHNANLSSGAMFLMPESLDEAKIRRQLEPLTELIQIKGSSECRWEAGKGDMWGTTDEQCSFEVMNLSTIGGSWIPAPERDSRTIQAGSFVRNTLAEGLQYEEEHDVNPFQLGFVGGLDNHNGTPGQSDEQEYARAGAHALASYVVDYQIFEKGSVTGVESNGGALTVAWAEENSRDSIFDAMQQRETYATSGTRPILRFFGGFDLPQDICSRDFAALGYSHGVPMGSCLGADAEDEDCLERQGRKAASFAISATMDPGWAGKPGTQLQRAQVVKGWLDEDGEVHEKVYDVAGTSGEKAGEKAEEEAGVDLATCRPEGPGHRSLCTVWTDPDFDPEERSFYYVRVLENPSCRWNQYYCNARRVDCQVAPGICQGGLDAGERCHPESGHLQSDCDSGVCQTPDSYSLYQYQQCCSGDVPSTVQQRAWSSPIWYRP